MNEKRWQIGLLVVLLALCRLESIGYILLFRSSAHTFLSVPMADETEQRVVFEFTKLLKKEP